jgi:hypothetical protein
MHNFSRVSLTIEHDWKTTIDKFHKLSKLEKNSIESYSYGNSQHFELGSLGNISKHTPSDHWYRLSGIVLHKTMPWLTDMLSLMKEIKPNDGEISYIKGNGAAHIDLPHMQTALNYIFYNSDSSAYTWVEHDGKKEKYISEVNTAWLLDTQKTHGIENSGDRWTLSIHFNTDYKTAREWFNDHPNLQFGNKG